LTLALLVSTGVASPAQSKHPQDVGYVVAIVGTGDWEAVLDKGKPRRLTAGAGVRPGETVRLQGGKAQPDQGLDVLLFATGAMRRLRSGEVIRLGAPTDSTLARLLNALRRWMDSETVGSGIVRGEATPTVALVRDTVLVWPGPHDWTRAFTGVPAGVYDLQFRRLSATGASEGDWTPTVRFEVTDTGMQPLTLGGAIGPGLWQMALRNARDPSRGGEGWVLFTTDPGVIRQFDELDTRLAASLRGRGAALGASAARIRRAALLEFRDTASR
jgi:hypothetical protein